MQCVVNGASNKEAASELSISENTVKVHLRNIYTKLGVSSRTEATTAALQMGLITIPGVETAVTDSTSSNTLPADETGTADIRDTPAAVTPPRRFNWQTAVIATALVVALGVIIVLFSRQMLAPAATPIPTATLSPFVEEPIGQTRWSTARPLTTGLANMATVAVGLNLYQIGGETDQGVVNAVQRYDTTQDTWQEMAAKPTAVADTTAAVLFGEIYVPGGRLADGTPTNRVEAYSPANNAWRPVANLPQAIAGGLTLTDGSYLYLFGGWDGENVLDTAFLYDLNTDSWRPLPPLPQAKAFAAGGQVTGSLYVVGGTDGDVALDSCHALDITTETWNDCPSMLAPRSGAGSAVLFNKLYVIGGLDGDQPITFSEFYDPNTATWQVVNTPMLEEHPTWSNMGVTNVETRIYALGGRFADELQAGSYVYTPVIYQTFIPAAAAESGGEATQEP